jgi:predicted exporter/SAM-dependent methyltransferase
LEEDITKVTNGNNSQNRYEYVVRNFKFADKLIVHFSLADTMKEADPELLISAADSVRNYLLSRLDSTYIRQVLLQFDASMLDTVQAIIYQHLPLFLSDADYRSIDSLMDTDHLHALLKSNYRLLMTPASMILKKRIVKDPLGLSQLAYRKLRSLQTDAHFILYDDCVFSRDKKHLLMIITTTNPSSETNKNSKLISSLKSIISDVSGADNKVFIDFYGYAATAVGNANQIKFDIILTLCIAVVLIILLLGWYFRNFLIPLLGFIPAFFGGGLGLVILYLVKGKISFIALGIGSVILALIIDYALYMVNHFRRKKSVEQVLEDMSHTILMCSITTIGVFLCLIFLHSDVLHDLGWFAVISVFGASLSSLIILPQFFSKHILPRERLVPRSNIIKRIAEIDYGKKTWLLIGLALAGIFSFFVNNKVSFEQDLNSLNYMSEPLKKAERRLDQISEGELKDVYIISTGKDLNKALISNEIVQRKLERLKSKEKIHEFSGISTLLLSDSIQHYRLNKWNDFWSSHRKELLLNRLDKEGKHLGYNGKAFDGLKQMLNTDYSLIPSAEIKPLYNFLFPDWVNQTPEMAMVSNTAKVTESEKHNVYDAFSGNPNLVIFDRQNLATQFVLTVKHDFELLISLSMLIVTLLLLISLGRIELALITSLPMFFSWLITLGFMGITGIKFNIFNIIISTFIFGLGVDYSILMMRGLLNQYRTGINDMKTYQTSVFLSSATTLIGVGVLFFAKHPALNSIALISIVGITSVVIISLSYQPLIARWILLNPQKKQSYPITARIIFHSLFIIWIPVFLIKAFLTIYNNLINPVLPCRKRRKLEISHQIVSFLSRLFIKINFPRHFLIENPDPDEFQKPSIILCNQQSLFDIPALFRLHSKLIIVNHHRIIPKWIFRTFRSPSCFVSFNENIDDSLLKLKGLVDDGYSLVIFPEENRSLFGNTQGFRSDAFYLAEKLRLDIIPVLILGGADSLPEGSFWGKPGRLFIKTLPVIKLENKIFGNDFLERTTLMSQYFNKEYMFFKITHKTPANNVLNLRLNYLFKGPVLEWYLRVKMAMENNFDTYCTYLPIKGEILDLGCGYGYISYMLKLTSDERTITGVDYDKKKITIAKNGYLRNNMISFVAADVLNYPITPKDGFLFGDVLHYLPYQQQESLLKDCINNLRPGGVILIREGNADKKKQHKFTKVTEFFSTKIIRFNKTQDNSRKLYFTSAQKLIRIAGVYGLNFEIVDQKRITSNDFFILRKPEKTS